MGISRTLDLPKEGSELRSGQDSLQMDAGTLALLALVELSDQNGAISLYLSRAFFAQRPPLLFSPPEYNSWVVLEARSAVPALAGIVCCKRTYVRSVF